MLLTVSDISKILNVNPETVRRWIRDGKILVSHFVGRSAQITLEELVRFANDSSGYYLDVMESWLFAHQIQYQIITKQSASVLPLVIGNTGAVLGSPLFPTPLSGPIGSAVTSHMLSGKLPPPQKQPVRQIVLTEQTLPIPLFSRTSGSNTVFSPLPEVSEQEEKIRLCQSHLHLSREQLSQLLQRQAQLTVEITALEHQVAYYRRMLEELTKSQEEEIQV